VFLVARTALPTIGRLLLGFALFLSACSDQYTVFHSQTGLPILLIKRAYTYRGCIETMRAEAARLGVTFRYIHVKGSWSGQTLLWPFDPGYACEAVIGPERPLSGAYADRFPLPM
jgi:hypothetical protein